MLQSKTLGDDLEVDSFRKKKDYFFVCDIWKIKCFGKVHLSMHCVMIPVVKVILLYLNYLLLLFCCNWSACKGHHRRSESMSLM